MNSDDIMNNDNKETYHATTNLNTAIENPQINVNSAVELNMRTVDDSFSNSNDVSNFQTQATSYSNTNIGGVDLSGDTGINQSNYDNTIINQSNYEQMQSFNGEAFNNQNLNSSVGVGNNDYVATDLNANASYQPVMNKKKKRAFYNMPAELKIVMFVVLILVVFLMLMPYIYDFFSNLQLIITD